MKLTLMIEASPSVMAKVIAALDGEPTSDVHVNVQPIIHTPIPTMPAAAPAAAPASSGAIAGIASDDGDDDGPADAGAPDVDSTGLPWDERIHSSSRKRGADGTWNKRRGGPKGEELAAIEAEIRGRSAPTPAPATPVVPPMPASGDPEPQQPVPTAPMPQAPQMPAAVPTAPTAPVMPQTTPAPMSIPAPAQPSTIGFPEFMAHLSQKMGDGSITTDVLIAAAGALGLNAITDLGVKPEKIPEAVALFTSQGQW